MGGYGSGRSGGRPTIEDGLTLDLGKLLRDRIFRPGTAWQGSIIWSETRTGTKVASIGYQAHLGDAHGQVRLQYKTTRWTGEAHAADYWVELTTTPQPFGGRRWWFVCPRSGQHVAKLYLPPGANTFASRKAYRLAYRSQRETDRDRALSRAFKLRRRLGSEDGIDEYIRRPKGMHHATFERAMTRVEAAEDIVDAHTILLMGRLTKDFR